MTSNYTPQTWHDLPATDTPIDATRLAVIESGIQTHVHSGDSAGGDLTGAYPNPALSPAGPGAMGPVGSSSVTPVITIDAKGRVTALTTAAITITGLALTVVKTADYQALAGDLVLVDTSSGAVVVTSPSLPQNGQLFGVKWWAGSTAPTITGTVDGVSGFTLPVLKSSITLQYDTALTSWVIY